MHAGGMCGEANGETDKTSVSLLKAAPITATTTI